MRGRSRALRLPARRSNPDPVRHERGIPVPLRPCGTPLFLISAPRTGPFLAESTYRPRVGRQHITPISYPTMGVAHQVPSSNQPRFFTNPFCSVKLPSTRPSNTRPDNTVRKPSNACLDPPSLNSTITIHTNFLSTLLLHQRSGHWHSPPALFRRVSTSFISDTVGPCPAVIGFTLSGHLPHITLRGPSLAFYHVPRLAREHATSGTTSTQHLDQYCQW